jgi:hypothetical protein
VLSGLGKVETADMTERATPVATRLLGLPFSWAPKRLSAVPRRSGHSLNYAEMSALAVLEFSSKTQRLGPWRSSDGSGRESGAGLHDNFGARSVS